MNSPLEGLLNDLIQNQIPTLNSSVERTIKSQGLDPIQAVYSGSSNLGTVNMGICSADANANYHLENLEGLSSLRISNMVVTSVQTSNNGSKLHGNINFYASFPSNLTASIGGKIHAACGLVHDSVDIEGEVYWDAVNMSANCIFEATLGSHLCLNSLLISNPSIGYGNMNVNIDGLGIFNGLLQPLKDVILGAMKNALETNISGQIAIPVNKAFTEALPQCTSV